LAGLGLLGFLAKVFSDGAEPVDRRHELGTQGLHNPATNVEQPSKQGVLFFQIAFSHRGVSALVPNVSLPESTLFELEHQQIQIRTEGPE